MYIAKVDLGGAVIGLRKAGERPDAYSIYVNAKLLREAKPEDIVAWLYNMVLPSLKWEEEKIEKPSFIRPLHLILEEVLSDLSQAVLGNVNAGNWKRAEYIVRQAIQVRHLIDSNKKDWEEFLKSGN